MSNKAYNSFTDISGNLYKFPNYEKFARWWFAIPYRRMSKALNYATFRRLQYEATQSKEARGKPNYTTI